MFGVPRPFEVLTVSLSVEPTPTQIPSFEAALALFPSIEAVLSTIGTSWLLAVTVVIVAWIGTKLLAIRIRPGLERRLLRPTTANLVIGTTRVAIILVALVPFAGLIGFQPGNVLLSFTVISAVAGVILAPVARSYVSGLFILLNRPYEVDDMIELVDEEERGYVDDVTLGYTKIFTLENSFLVIPNETMRERDVRNLSAEDERSRVSIDVVVTYEGDLEEACSLLERAARDADGVIEGGPRISVGRSRFPAGPTAFVREFADHGVVLDLRLWVDEPYLPAKVRSDVRRNVFAAFTDADVEFAYPHTHHVFDETSGHARVVLDRESQGEVAAAMSDRVGVEKRAAD